MPQSAEQIVESVLQMPQDSRIQVLAPLVKDRKGHHQGVFEDVRKAGFVRVRVNGEVRQVDEEIELDRYKNHTIEAVVDRLIIRHAPNDDSEEAKADRTRLTDSVETALALGSGIVIINDVTDRDNQIDQLYSEHLYCPYDGTSIPEIEPRTFSFNSPHGACPVCQGLGTKKELDDDLIVPNKDLTLAEGAITGWPTDDKAGYYWQLLKATADHFKIPTNVPVRELNEAQMRILLHGSGDETITVTYVNRDGDTRHYRTKYEGVVPNLWRRYNESTSDYVRDKLESFMVNRPCSTCAGTRLQPVALAVTIDGTNIADVTRWAVARSLPWAERLRDDGVLTTIDIEPEYQRIAKHAFAEGGIGPSRTRLITGRAQEVLTRLADESYDLVFVDADPSDQPDYVAEGIRLLRPGGVIVVHHASLGGRAGDPEATDAAVTAVREAARMIAEDERLIPVLIPLGDGLLAAAREQSTD